MEPAQTPSETANHEDPQPDPHNWDWVFNGPSGPTRKDVLRWWEQRRIHYNKVMLAIGVISWLLVLVAASVAVKRGDDFEEPIMLLVGPLIYVALANVCYSFGPALDFIAFRARPRKTLFRAGLFFAAFITSLPGLWALAASLETGFSGQKLP